MATPATAPALPKVGARIRDSFTLVTFTHREPGHLIALLVRDQGRWRHYIADLYPGLVEKERWVMHDRHAYSGFGTALGEYDRRRVL